MKEILCFMLITPLKQFRWSCSGQKNQSNWDDLCRFGVTHSVESLLQNMKHGCSQVLACRALKRNISGFLTIQYLNNLRKSEPYFFPLLTTHPDDLKWWYAAYRGGKSFFELQYRVHIWSRFNRVPLWSTCKHPRPKLRKKASSRNKWSCSPTSEQLHAVKSSTSSDSLFESSLGNWIFVFALSGWKFGSLRDKLPFPKYP